MQPGTPRTKAMRITSEENRMEELSATGVRAGSGEMRLRQATYRSGFYLCPLPSTVSVPVAGFSARSLSTS